MSPHDGDRRFATILFTDIVGSTDIARELGDQRWRELVRRHHAIVRRELRRFDGREMDTAGDGFFAIFESPGAAIRCAVAISLGVREVGLEIRAGLHGGEVEFIGGKAGGIAVNTAARVMGVGGAGEVLVSSTVREVVFGSSLVIEDHGVHSLKGIEGEWRLFALVEADGEPLEPPLDPGEASKRRLAIEPAGGGSRARSRTVTLVLGVLAVVAVAVALFLVFGSNDEPRARGPTAPVGASGPPPGSVARIDAQTGKVEIVRTDVPTNDTPQVGSEDIDVGEGSVWLGRRSGVYKLDPEDGSHTTIQLSTPYVEGIDVGLGAMWALVGDGIAEVDPATGRASDVIPLPRVPGVTDAYADDAVGRDAVWVATRGPYVIRYDPRSGTSERIPLGGAASSTPEVVGVGAAAVWLLDESSGVVWRIDESTGDVLAPIAMQGSLDRIAVGEGFAWVLDGTLGSLTPIPVDGSAPRPAIDVGSGANDVAVGLGSVWVASGGNVLEIDPATLHVTRTIHVGDTRILRLAIDEENTAIWLDMASAG